MRPKSIYSLILNFPSRVSSGKYAELLIIGSRALDNTVCIGGEQLDCNDVSVALG